MQRAQLTHLSITPASLKCGSSVRLVGVAYLARGRYPGSLTYKQRSSNDRRQQREPVPRKPTQICLPRYRATRANTLSGFCEYYCHSNMAPSLVRPQGHLSPAEALELAQKAPTILRNNPNAFSSSPLVSLFSASETPEIWIIYENLLLACLRTGDGQAAHQCLERLVIRFGDDNERIMAFKGLVKEAEADNDGELVQVLKEYETILGQNATNIPVAKRRVALLKSTGKISEAISALNSLLDFSPTDAEAWAELADLYLSQGLYSQAIFALEEVLVLTPNAWNIHARMGEVLYMAASASDGSSQQQLAESVKRFARSIELCDDYLRGYYGLKLATNKLLKEPSKPSRQTDADDWAVPDTNAVQKLNEVATQKLAEIVRRNSAKDRLWQGYDESEVAAARDLLSKESVELVR
ncbi:tetratricopeptide repeat domain-containing protein [Colletotrichum chrysophilum]|uniref:ER membrane protein complex subunit 2 n=1 Tax=Colletotrichum chrysophilum TaxID=1836956 RepID=A0AAD9AB85_9PEZI|nr:tetratricopeptide repeat domain-containing protein [Colletotrichum chrysophilum]